MPVYTMMISILTLPPHQDRFTQVQTKCQFGNFTSTADICLILSISKVNSTETFTTHVF